MTRFLSDDQVRHLRGLSDAPDLTGTRYTLLSQLGEGGMGVVYRAFDGELGREVALKVLHLELDDVDSSARLAREAQILAGLEHPGIVPVHETGFLPDGRSYYVMKQVCGERLDAVVRGSLSRARRFELFERICDTVAFAHARGVVHRDLKPENVMVGSFGETLVLDWGVAKVLERAPDASGPLVAADSSLAPPQSLDATWSMRSTDGAAIGTPAYMAPEQRRGEAVDARSDVYALGVLLYFLLAGVPAPGPGTAPPGVPRPLASICRRATAEAPASRYPSAAALADDVRRFQAGESVAAHREAWFERSLRLANRFRTPLLLVGAYLIVRLILLLVARG